MLSVIALAFVLLLLSLTEKKTKEVVPPLVFDLSIGIGENKNKQRKKERRN